MPWETLVKIGVTLAYALGEVTIIIIYHIFLSCLCSQPYYSKSQLFGEKVLESMEIGKVSDR